MIRVLVVDGRPVTREGLLHVLGKEPDLQVEATTQLPDHQPTESLDVLIGGLDSVADGQCEPPVLSACFGIARSTVVLSDEGSPGEALSVLRTGARGYLCSSASPKQVVDAVKAAACGERYLDRATACGVVDLMLCQMCSLRGDLSSRERQVLALLTREGSSKAVAQALRLSPKTIATYVARLRSKMRVQTTEELVARARVWGIVD